ncbi:GPI mannosyltransferase 3 [Metschnikowia bicuspidata var. bicuspidata NRRL YB-4993]|uniref:Mannosyltransferase n=1 Tax=Metschnikowia bicuspidata var. bicuspidata NRRL YB-4993 TaxID=869754 RepID=A0A1A0H5Z4_9ASCO|nr:GPI mannosyltransferase 3 [Metschnikowia bicuspidata var. bicuspidata NRRL YB-4993]OBA19327.1 GPI mannosyltransferase 3 [Metschnikowia bicuspidata var. bicuspidata NRRL YB-4993]
MSLVACLCVFFFRLLNAFFIRTFFQPDEYYQALEPAHRLVYGYGYLTWEWHEALRSSLHPLLYAFAYKLFNIFILESWAVVVAPKIMGALIATTSDIYTYWFASRYWQSPSVAKVALGLSLISSWNWYVSTRSFLNNLEMALTAAGLSYWPWHQYKLMPLLISCLFGFLSCIVRPTNSILWAFLAVCLLAKNIRRFSRLVSLLVSVSLVFMLTSMLASLADRFFYGRWTFPIYNFLEFNVFRNLLIFYGSAPWHFYLLQGIPLILMGYLPLFCLAIYQYRRTTLVGLCVFFVSAFSLIAHKEFRFLQPLHPVMITLCAKTIYQRRHINLAKLFVFVVVIFHLFIAYFFTRVHEAGEIRVVELLRDDPMVESIGFLTPCHSTPWHSMFHRPDLISKSWFLTCEPPLHFESGTAENIQTYRDQLDLFFDDPVTFLQSLPYEWPSHLVLFQPMQKVAMSELTEYYECKRVFNGYFHWDPRRSGDIIVYCRKEILMI